MVCHNHKVRNLLEFHPYTAAVITALLPLQDTGFDEPYYRPQGHFSGMDLDLEVRFKLWNITG